MYVFVVIVSTKSNGNTQTENYNVKSLSNNTSSSKTLVLAVDQRKPGATMTLYVNCEHFGTLQTTRTLREVYFDMRDPHLQMVSNYQSYMKNKIKNYTVYTLKSINKLNLYSYTLKNYFNRKTLPLLYLKLTIK